MKKLVVTSLRYFLELQDGCWRRPEAPVMNLLYELCGQKCKVRKRHKCICFLLLEQSLCLDCHKTHPLKFNINAIIRTREIKITPNDPCNNGAALLSSSAHPFNRHFYSQKDCLRPLYLQIIQFSSFPLIL